MWAIGQVVPGLPIDFHPSYSSHHCTSNDSTNTDISDTVSIVATVAVMADLGSITTDFVADINAIASIPANDKPPALSQLLEKILSHSAPQNLEGNLSAYITHLLASDVPIAGVRPSEPLSIIALRPLLANFVSSLSKLETQAELQASLATLAIRLLQPRVVSFEEQDTSLKLLLADAHQANEDFAQTARALDSITLTSPQRPVPDAEKCQIWTRIARCYLEDDDSTAAATYINRAKNILHNIPTTTTEGQTLRLHFQSAQARILDSQRAFLDASSSYHALSFEPLIDEDDRLQSLTAAIICAVLAPAGPQRARTLARLYKDDRSAQLAEFPILEKIFLDRVLSPEEVKAFADKLQPHQLAKTADGSTVLERAVLEHNLLGASRLYRNISISGLGELLGTDTERAEQYAASMIEQGRLRGSIDQIDGVIFFEGGDAGAYAADKGDAAVNGASGKTTGMTQGSELRRWDAQIQGLLAEVESVTTMIQGQAPEFYARHMVA